MGSAHVASAHRPHDSPTRRLLRLLAEERADVGRVYAYAALAGLLGLSVPLGVQAIIGLVSGGMLLQPVVVLIGLVVLGTFAAGVLQIVQLGVVERLQQRVFARHALELGHRVPRVDPEAVGAGELPELTNRFFEVVAIQKSLAKLLTEAVAALLSILAGLVLLTFYHPYLSLFGAVLLGGLAVALWLTGHGGLRTSLVESSAKYRVAHWLQELARHAPVLRGAGATSLPVARMDHEVDDYLAARQAHFRVLVHQSLVVVAGKTLVTGGLLVIGAALVVDRKITLGQFVAAELVIVTVLAGVEKLIFSLSTVYDALTAVEKLGHLGDLPVLDAADDGHATPGDPAGGLALPRAGAAGMAVEVRSLSYRHPGQAHDTLCDLSLDVRPGERVAIVAAEGAGASTLLRALAGLLPSYGGVLAFDGVSVRDARPEAVRAAVALVSPTPSLLDGTLEENLVLGRPAIDAARVVAALELVGLRDYVRALPDGLRTRVAGGAARLPSHVVRKLALARALAGTPRLLLLDEFFHHLEPTYKRQLLGRLLAPTAGWTVVAASHDPAFLAACDRLLLLDGGQVVAEGSYDALAGELAWRGLVRSEVPGDAGEPTRFDGRPRALGTSGSRA
ncbi:MAG: peptidase domain-containing ABC transporter [Gemmatirosa sp.]